MLSEHEAVDTPAKPTRHQRSTAGWRKRWGFRSLAVLLGLTPFVFGEMLCRGMGWGKPDLSDDPFVGFQEIRPLFVLDEQTGRYEIPPARQNYFYPESFAAQKPDDEFRVFCLGGSTVQGRPYSIETAFSTWLEIALRQAAPHRRWEAINCGGVSYASYRLTPVLREVLQYQPDLIVLYTGHNEFLEDRQFEQIRNRGRLVNAAVAAAGQLRLYNVAKEAFVDVRREQIRSSRSRKSVMPAEVSAVLDFEGGLESYERDLARRDSVVDHFAFSVRRMVQTAGQAGVPIILANPVSNLSDCPPFKSQHGDLTAEQRRRFDELCDEARSYFRADRYSLAAAIKCFEEAVQIDPLHAGTWYTLAECYRNAGRIDDAQSAFLRAKDEDVCPLRILEPMNRAVLRIAEEEAVPCVDAEELFRNLSAEGIVGANWLVDHVHPSIEGHQRIAEAILEKMKEAGLVELSIDSAAARQAAYDEHLADLDEFYFAKAQERLRSLRKWSQSRLQRASPPH